MVKASPRIKEEPSPPEDSIQPLPNETLEEWNKRVDRMLQEFRERKSDLD